MKYLTIISFFFLFFTGCTTKQPSLADKVAELQEVLKSRQDLNIDGENVTVTLENDNKTINFSFNNNILFDFNKYKIKSEFRNSLKIATNFLIKNPTFGVIVEGHTDSVGNKEYNQKLSEKRALAVTSILIEQGVASERISSIGYGEELPKIDNDTEEGRYKNRRAEIRVKENIQNFISVNSTSSKSSSKTLSSDKSYTSNNSIIEDEDEKIPEECKVAKPVSGLFTAITMFANAGVSYLRGDSALDGAKTGYDLAQKERWIKGVKYICK